VTLFSTSISVSLTEPCTKPELKVRVMDVLFAIPVGVVNVIVWSDPVLGPELDTVSDRLMTFAASTYCSDGNPTDQRSMVRDTIAAVAWSIENEFDVLCILYVVLNLYIGNIKDFPNDFVP
jgi:hypothetical protein